jgi:hypothetical protein
MANGIGRKRTMGIAKETTYGTIVGSPTFTLPLLDTPRVEIVQNKEENIAALGSTYAVNALMNTNRMVNFSMNIKIDEDHLPLFLLQRYTIDSDAHSGETVVYDHVATYAPGATTSYTLFLDDDDRTSIKMAGCKFESMNFSIEQGYIRVEVSGKGIFSDTWVGSNTVAQPKEFVGRHAVFGIGADGAGTTNTSIIKAMMNHSFTLSGDDFNFELGNQNMTALEVQEDRYELEVTKRFTNFTFRDYYTNNTKLEWDMLITDTARNVTGSVASTKPSILAEYPVGYMSAWAEEGGLGDSLTETFTLLAVDEVGVATAPAQFTITNAIASY